VPNDKRTFQLRLAEKYAREQLEAGRRYGAPEAVAAVMRASGLDRKWCSAVLQREAWAMRREGGAG